MCGLLSCGFSSCFCCWRWVTLEKNTSLVLVSLYMHEIPQGTVQVDRNHLGKLQANRRRPRAALAVSTTLEGVVLKLEKNALWQYTSSTSYPHPQTTQLEADPRICENTSPHLERAQPYSHMAREQYGSSKPTHRIRNGAVKKSKNRPMKARSATSDECEFDIYWAKPDDIQVHPVGTKKSTNTRTPKPNVHPFAWNYYLLNQQRMTKPPPTLLEHFNIPSTELTQILLINKPTKISREFSNCAARSHCMARLQHLKGDNNLSNSPVHWTECQPSNEKRRRS